MQTMKTKWQTTIDELLVVFKTAKELTKALNKELDDNTIVYETTISRIRKGKQRIVDHDIGQAMLILHVRYIPIKGKCDG